MILLGVDPGTASTGYGVVKLSKSRVDLVTYGVIRTSNKQDMPGRLLVLYKNLIDLIKSTKPDLLVVEKIFFNSNAKTAMTVGQARGVVMLSAASANINIIEYTALQAKKTLTGFGRASKQEMQTAVRRILDLSTIIKSDDANDGVAMALCYYLKTCKK